MRKFMLIMICIAFIFSSGSCGGKEKVTTGEDPVETDPATGRPVKLPVFETAEGFMFSIDATRFSDGGSAAAYMDGIKDAAISDYIIKMPVEGGDEVVSSLVGKVKEIGKNAWLSVKMNRGQSLYDYSDETVYNAMLAYITGILGEYQSFGIELDFSEGAYFPLGRELDNDSVLSDFLKDLKKADKDIIIGVKFPADVEVAMRRGIDVFGFANKRLIKALFPVSQNNATDNSMGVKMMSTALSANGSGVMLAPVVSSHIEGRAGVIKPNTFGTVAGSIAAFGTMGGHKVYLDGYDNREIFKDMSDVEYDFLLNNANNVEAFVTQQRRHPNTGYQTVLCNARNSYKYERIVTGNIPENAVVKLRMGVKRVNGNTQASDIVLYVNSNRVTSTGTVKYSTEFSDLTIFTFTLPAAAVKDVYIVEYACDQYPFNVDYMEIVVENK